MNIAFITRACESESTIYCARADYRHPLFEPAGSGSYKLRDEKPDSSDIEQEILDITETKMSLERDLETFIIKEISTIEPGLTLYGNNSNQVSVESGRIDVLAKDSSDIFTVIELKAGKAKDGVLAQILAYMVDIKRRENTEDVRGIIIAHDFSPRLTTAVSHLSNVKLLKYNVTFDFTEQTQ